MTVEQFVKQYGTRGFGLMVRRAVSDPGWSPSEWAHFYSMLEELEVALEKAGRPRPSRAS